MSGHSSHSGPGHETIDVTFKHTIWLIPVCILLLVAYVAVCWFGATASLTREMTRKQGIGAEAGAETLKAFRAHEDSTMHEYGWKDKDKGVVQMPIDQAMKMMTAKIPNDTAKAQAR